MPTIITAEKSLTTDLSSPVGRQGAFSSAGQGAIPGPSLLRFLTAGSVDDGKSTLIGRLLYDSKSIMVDQLEAIQKQTKNKAQGEIDLALLTDGLRAEREQGITIDVAYKYFSTPRRKFIIADTPGHIQYTRNMFTGASTANLIVILIDVRNGVIEQTRRHSIIASLLRIPHVVVAINKIDLVGYSETAYNNLVAEYQPIAESLGLKDITYIPLSAAYGDNIVEASDNTPWYTGKPLLQHLEEVEVYNDTNHTDPRFQVQYVLRPQTEELHDYRGYAGSIISGTYRVGNAVKVLPVGIETTISKIEVAGKDADTATVGQPAVLHLANDIDVSRGDAVVQVGNEPTVSNEVEAVLCWMDSDKPLSVGSKYLLQQGSRRVKAMVKEIQYKLDVNTLQQTEATKAVLNDVVKVKLKTASPLVYDSYQKLKANGSAILIDETSNATAAAVLLT